MAIENESWKERERKVHSLEVNGIMEIACSVGGMKVVDV